MTEFDPDEFREGYHVHEEVRCDGCNEAVDLSEADDIHEAIDIWNEHVEEDHADEQEAEA